MLLEHDLDVVNAEILCLAMIETVDGLERADAICATPGLDGVYIGPADLAVTWGRRYRRCSAIRLTATELLGRTNPPSATGSSLASTRDRAQSLGNKRTQRPHLHDRDGRRVPTIRSSARAGRGTTRHGGWHHGAYR